MFSWHFVPGLDRGELKKAHWDANLRQKKFDAFFEAQAAFVDLFLMAEGKATMSSLSNTTTSLFEINLCALQVMRLLENLQAILIASRTLC